MLTPSAVDLAMAQRRVGRHARILNEFGYYTAGQLADASDPQAVVEAARSDAQGSAA
ncbi:MAG: hypothetical protein WCY32_03470 [Burkholderiaceae bacterium]